jgi:3-deoxy-D-manno-octulosonic-acid transferase
MSFADSLLALYRAAGLMATPLVVALLRRRAARGKEDAGRFGERLGIASRARPAGSLVWVHAASVGEINSVLPLVRALLDERPHLAALVTTGTVTSARLAERDLPARAIHQFAPVDLPAAAARFLGHWRPDLVLWTESEFWPGLIGAVAAAGVPLVLVNGRVSARSFARWRRARPLIRLLLGRFALCLAQSQSDARRLVELGAGDVRYLGNLKLAAPPLGVDEGERARLAAILGRRPRWLAASTHAGEEEAALAVHCTLAARAPGFLTLIVPRHPDRGPAIAEMARRQGLRAARRAANEALAAETEVYIADTMGEMGLWYRLAPVIFVGGSLVRHGGQNPIEPARLGAALLHGPHMDNFAEIVAELEAVGGSRTVADAVALTRAVAELVLDDPRSCEAMAQRARDWAQGQDDVLARVRAALAPLLAGL